MPFKCTRLHELLLTILISLILRIVAMTLWRVFVFLREQGKQSLWI